MAKERTLVLTWNEPQTRFLLTRAKVGGPLVLIDLEGAVRAGKSTPACAKLCDYATAFPGIQMAAARWSQDALDAQVKPLWRDWAAKYGLPLKWHSEEQFDEVLGTAGPDGRNSRVYLRALKSSEDAARYGKLAGLTLGILWIDQPEEMPQDVYEAYVPARLSQPGYPHEVWLTPNPPGLNHWIAQKFPEQGRAPNHHYFITSVYDNAHNLGEAYIADLEAAYPVGTALRRRFVDGRRGLAVLGTPVYQGYFSRKLHEVDIRFDPELDLIESWDFGSIHPAVSWSQFTHGGGFAILGGVMAENMYLEDFLPEVAKIRKEWFTDIRSIKWTGDPAGTARSSQGTSKSAADLLKDRGIHLHVVKGANVPSVRMSAIQALAAYMRRMTPQGPAFAVNPRCWLVGKGSRRMMPIIVDALEAGYVLDDHDTQGFTMPKKDQFYDHLMNTVEYALIKYGPNVLAPDPVSPTRIAPTDMPHVVTPGSWMT